ncbi:MAG TPA: DNA/RNA nuclease SfsA [Candidatus Marinimicrobia bacterium]|nr:DNA/RNA nuclease SfsA [Candidatus Neomarinimicrobiota bacterium]
MQIYRSFTEAAFIRRLNRFVMELDHAGQTIQAYVPNTGRMSEFLVAGQPFYVTESARGKYRHKVVSTQYQDNYVFLDTVRVNDIFHQLLRDNRLSALFPDIQSVRREVSVLNSRFDFCIEHLTGPCSFIEIKSCTLIHNRVAMFPDAPTLRGQRHIRELQQLSENDRNCHVVFLIINGSAISFFPNFHTDYAYGLEFLNAPNVQFHALVLNLTDPVTIDLSSIREIPINFSLVKANCTNKGNYLLLLENAHKFSRLIGKLGECSFPKGYYIYVGSAMKSLDSRIRRHRSRRKKRHWHIDYLIPEKMQLQKIFPIRRDSSIESNLANKLLPISDLVIPHFGSADTPDASHLCYFAENPIHNRRFLDILLDAQTFTIS